MSSPYITVFSKLAYLEDLDDVVEVSVWLHQLGAWRVRDEFRLLQKFPELGLRRHIPLSQVLVKLALATLQHIVHVHVNC